MIVDKGTEMNLKLIDAQAEKIRNQADSPDTNSSDEDDSGSDDTPDNTEVNSDIL